jgi:signal transduction histidine kinase
MKRIASGERIAILHDPQALARGVILLLDADTLQRRLIDALVARHFGTPEQSEYFVSVQSRDATPQLVFASNPGIGLTAANADLATGMFDLRLDEMMPMDAAVPPPPGLSAEQMKTMKDRVAITIVRRAATADRSATSAGDGSGAWQVLIRSKDGSLDAVVARSRRRNLAIGLGVLGLLAASFVFLVGSAQRQQRLARQQMEFVAAVSHELRTPLAVIRSAGDNLADGVVADGEQVKKYGALIGKEGRRLSEMVERVMEYAGISQSASAPTLREVDLTRIVGAAVEGIQTDARDREVTVALSAEREIPPLSGDETALRSAVQNVVGNAVKYSAAGATVQVTLARDRDRVTLTVADRGLGIDASDLPHIFKPFYRGRRAVEAQIRGTGIGLSVVRHVVEGHHGNVHVDSRAGEGTTVTISLPAAPRREGLVGDAAPRAAT